MKTTLATCLSVTGQTCPTRSNSLSQYLSAGSPCKDINRFFPEILVIKEPCNLIGWQHFDLLVLYQNFSRHRVCTGRKNNKIFCNRVLSARHNEKNFTKTLKKTYFCPIFVQFCPQNKTFREKFGSATFERLWFSNVMHNISKNQWADSKKSMSGADQWAHK